ncbi:MAG: DUF4097 family beta strand repeat protein [Clostridia bacterium]|nr:DUF4097 family beta strand repeat protein [Clostridia bacterium]
MKKSTKIWLVVASSLMVIGLITFAAVMTEYNWDFMKLSTEKYETNTHEITEDFNNISINTDTANIIFALSDSGKCKVECYESKKSKHSVITKDDTLIIKTTNKRNWYDYVGIHFGSPKITIFLPKAKYSVLSINQDTGDILLPKYFKFASADILSSTGDVNFFASASKPVKIKTSTGHISVKDSSVKALDLTASTGDIIISNVTCKKDINIRLSTGETDLTDIKCKNLKACASTGNITLKNVISQETFSIKTSTGNVKFDHSDAKEIFTETDTGNVVGSLLKDKIFITSTDTGRVDVPKTVSGGKCEIITDTGDIKITVNKE